MKTNRLSKSLVSVVLTTLCLFIGMSVAMAQRSVIDQLEFGDQNVRKQGDFVSLDMNIDISGIRLLTNDVLIVTPTLQSNTDKNRISRFSPIIITGSVRNKVVNRQIRLNTEQNYAKLNPVAIVKRENNKTQILNYRSQIPFEAWMKDASLIMVTEMRGCADCDLGSEEKTLLAKAIEEYVPKYGLTYIVPEPEPIKGRSERHSASLNFQFDRYELLRNYKNNAAELDKVDQIIKEIQHNADLTVTEFLVVGYASPEGPFEYNRVLSRNRANAFTDYLESMHKVNRSQLRVEDGGEDWEGLRKAVEASTLPDKQEILRIIDEVPNPDARDAELMKLSDGTTYRILLNHYYPPLRRTDYTIAFNVKDFSVEEAREYLKTNPKLLSLNEMFLVAQLYPPDSKEFKEVFDIAVRLYPNDPVAIVNSAAADIENGNFTAALERLNKIQGDPRAWNNLGVACALTGNLEKAKEYFEKAISKGDEKARQNAEELQKFMSNNGMN